LSPNGQGVSNVRVSASTSVCDPRSFRHVTVHIHGSRFQCPSASTSACRTKADTDEMTQPKRALKGAGEPWEPARTQKIRYVTLANLVSVLRCAVTQRTRLTLLYVIKTHPTHENALLYVIHAFALCRLRSLVALCSRTTETKAPGIEKSLPAARSPARYRARPYATKSLSG